MSSSSSSSSTNEAMDLSDGSRRRANGPKAGSVWESRMKLDQFKGGIKVFDTNHTDSEPNNPPKIITTSATNSGSEVVDELDTKKLSPMMRPKQSPVGGSGKRRTWNSEGSPVQIVRQRSELSKDMDEQSKESSVSPDGIIKKKSPVQIKKTRSHSNGEKDKILRRLRSDPSEPSVKSEKSESLDELCDVNLKEGSVSVKAKTGAAKNVLDQSSKSSDVDESVVGFDKSPIGRSDHEDCKELVVCEEKKVTSNLDNVVRAKIAVDDDDSVDSEEEENWEGGDEVKKMNVDEQKKTNRFVIEEKKLIHCNERPVAYSPIVKKQSTPVFNHAKTHHPSPTKNKPIPVRENLHGISRSHSKLQSFVDLVMWRDVSKSAFIFGIGSFGIISSSYTKDLNISFISVVSYLGLVYLAAIFIFRSLIKRGSINNMEDSDQEYVVGEEEAVWVIKLVLPYINEFLLKLRALFSGDPATTMKLAVLLFILARCGSSITIWKMTRLGFFGVFIVPKVCSSYSSQLAAFGTFWIRRFGDAWASCSHKKAVGFAIFTLVWNLSSVVARIWAVFMLFVAFKYYQQSLIREEWAYQEARPTETSAGQNIGGQRQGRRPTLADSRKPKKVC